MFIDETTMSTSESAADAITTSEPVASPTASLETPSTPATRTARREAAILRRSAALTASVMAGASRAEDAVQLAQEQEQDHRATEHQPSQQPVERNQVESERAEIAGGGDAGA